MGEVIDFRGTTGNERRSETPHNDLTRLCDRMINSITEDAEGVFVVGAEVGNAQAIGQRGCTAR